jgi:predicted nucleic acid-binding protein
MLLLDTNVVSELRKVKTGKANPQFSVWAEQLQLSQLYISAITVMEIELGILQIERRDQHQAHILRQWFEHQILPTFEGRILPVDVKVALTCARLHVPDPRSERDALIAATAITHGMTVVTRNIADFKATHVGLFNPWQI